MWLKLQFVLTSSSFQYVKTNFTHPNRFILPELNNGHFLIGTFTTQSPPTMPAMVRTYSNREIFSTLLTRICRRPSRRLAQLVQQSVQKLLAGHLIIKNWHPIVIFRAQTSVGFDQNPAQITVTLHVGQQQRGVPLKCYYSYHFTSRFANLH